MIRLNPILERETPTKPSPYSREPWMVVECLETGMVYLENPPAYADLNVHFAWEKTYANETILRQQREPVFSLASRAVKKIRGRLKLKSKMVKTSVALLVKMAKEGEVVRTLDIGCGSAAASYQIAQEMRDLHGIEVKPVGIEISEKLQAAAEERLRPFDGEIIHAPGSEGVREIEKSSIDLIVLCSYLEHEIQPLEVLRRCRDVLTEHGRIVIKVPNYGCLNRMVRQGRWCGFRYPDHVNYFTPRTLRILVENAGLRIARLGFRNRLPTNDNMLAVVARRN